MPRSSRAHSVCVVAVGVVFVVVLVFSVDRGELGRSVVVVAFLLGGELEEEVEERSIGRRRLRLWERARFRPGRLASASTKDQRLEKAVKVVEIVVKVEVGVEEEENSEGGGRRGERGRNPCFEARLYQRMLSLWNVRCRQYRSTRERETRERYGR